MTTAELLSLHASESIRVKQAMVEACGASVSEAANLLADCFKSGGKVLICGNGGSAADAQHFATEYMSRLSAAFERPAMPAIALTTDTSFLTAHSNDYGFEDVFARQVHGLAKAGDVLIGISTSGNSKNVLRAVEAARELGVKTIGMLGGNGGALASQMDVPIVVPSEITMHVQESHLVILHVLVAASERLVYQPSN